MLYVLIPVVWLAVMALVVAVCRMAARGDRTTADVERTEIPRVQATEIGMLTVLDSDPELPQDSPEQEPVTVATIARRPLRRRGYPRRLPRRPVSRA